MNRLPLLRPLTLCIMAVVGFASAPLYAQSSQDQASQEHANAEATFAGGCFWCMEPPYDNQPGVSATISGYIGGELENPSYEDITRGNTGHAEVVQIEYDPEQISYAQLLEIFWRNIDPFAVDRQFCDVGDQYRAAIFYHNDEQRELAEASKAEMEARFDREIATQIVPATTFWPAEEYHQDYYQKNPVRYKFYRYSCGRDGRLEEVWGEEAGGPTFE
ncbi:MULTISPECIES: peptide-methionine (S)-S-oxide reductase MsrA [unclassified Halomonas]|uniref:peptide-methionine (S)-S-oxide reductase MsrA n=1 Tax=unclassified Halomonas TaxID=2609666 RepID=UPI0007D916F7|nr:MULTISPECIES: peptide-methionine (S)-S-oxide reductase MsrA [unclassified Halomonas]MBT2785198.1 peptide-methionine (S)-S-oxide reductase MsrA [Halomonas sp. ISL-106]MBT2796892.1 peptide-methionine (S)-S-oxide reductase MsrA [Halomonas sp. ISL-104]OAL60112.1 peptide-methionine (S)-S-oxide reductase [Halomonas sp. ALS9]